MDILNTFQTLTFPIAVCAVLFGILWYFIKSVLALIKDYLKEIREQQKAREDALINIIKEETNTISNNTNAYNSLSVMTGKLISIFEKNNK